MSQEYIGALAILLVSAFKIFGVEVENQIIAGLLTGVIGLWIAVRRHSKGDITIVGVRK